jgi:uncharacterized protein (DUF58 family)
MKSVKVNVKDILSKVSELNLTKKGVKNFLMKYESEFVGLESIEFYGFREYSPEDNPRTIDWKSSIRTGNLLCRETLIEKEPEVIVVVDCGASTLYGSVDTLKVERALELAIGISHICLSVGFTVGAILYNDKVKSLAHPKSGRIQLTNIAQTLLKPVLFGAQSNLNTTVSLINSWVRRESVVIFISDFMKFDDDNKHMITMLSLRCRVMGIMLRDVLDKEIPSGGNVIFQDPTSSESLLVDTGKIGREYALVAKEQERAVMRKFINSNARIFKLYTDESFEANFHKLILENAKF